MHLAQELWDQVSSYLTSIAATNAADALDFKPDNFNKDRHGNLWGAIFKKDTWLQTAVKQNAIPVLIGADIKDYYRESPLPDEDIMKNKRKPRDRFMILLIVNMEGNLQYKHNEFLFSLRPDFCYNKDTREYVSRRGLKFRLEGDKTDTIDTRGVDVNAFFFERVLQKQIVTNYCFWNDPKKKRRFVEPKHIHGIGGIVAVRKDLAPIFNLYLYLSKTDRPIQAIFSSLKEGSTIITNPVFSGEKDYVGNRLCDKWDFNDEQDKKNRYHIQDWNSHRDRL